MLIVLIALLLVPEDAVSLDCDYAIALYENAAKDCKSGKRYKGAKYQPCEYTKLLEKNYGTCTGKPHSGPQSGFGNVPLNGKIIEEEDVYGIAMVAWSSQGKSLIISTSSESYQEAKFDADKQCHKDQAWRCKEIARFGNRCFAVVSGANTGFSDRAFFTSEGDSIGQVEIDAIGKCEVWLPPNLQAGGGAKPFADWNCFIKASGCSPDELVTSMKNASVWPTTLDALGAKHKKEYKEKVDAYHIERAWSEARHSLGGRSHKNPEWVRGIQLGLQKHGFYLGPIDGRFGPKTNKALGDWQKSLKEPATGMPTFEQEDFLMDWDSTP